MTRWRARPADERQNSMTGNITPYSTYPLKWSIIFGGFQLFGRNFLGAIILANDHFQTHFLSELSEQRNRSKSTKINRFWADSKGNSIQKLLKIDDFQAKIAYHYLSILSKNKHFYWKIKGNSLQKCSIFAKFWTLRLNRLGYQKCFLIRFFALVCVSLIPLD